MMNQEAVRLTRLGAGMTMVEGGPVDVVRVKSRWQVSAERFFRKAKINVGTLNRSRLFRKFRLEVGTDQEYMECRLSQGKGCNFHSHAGYSSIGQGEYGKRAGYAD
jgi:hypothetical protein